MTVSLVTLVRLFLSAGALVLVLLSLATWSRHRRAPEAALVSLLSVSAAIYCFGSAQEMAQTSLDRAMFWIHVQYLGLPWLPALWVLLARKHHQLRSRLWLLLVIPVITFAGQWTNSLHGLFYASVQLIPRPPFWIVSVHRGPIAWLFLVYLYASFGYGAWVYLSRFRVESRLIRKQSLLFAACSLPPLGGYLVYLLGWSPWGLDLGPAALGISVILAYLAVVRLEFFDLVPMARSLVFNSMRDAALVTDLGHRLVDFNPAARKLLPCLGNIKLGDDLTSALSEPLSFEQVFLDSGHPQRIELRAGGKLQNYEVRVLPLQVEDQQSGWAIILADITAQVRLVHELRHDAETDELTGVANRRCFANAMERECSRSMRHGSIFSVMIVDIDHFKEINDRCGHNAGDSVLTAVASRIASCLRRVDLLSRYGGDEFAVLLPEAGLDGALEVAERIRGVVASPAVEYEGQAIDVSVSVGLTTQDATHTGDWPQLLDEADQALYRAKAEGRNRVVRWNGLASAVAAINHIE
jgi:diguanylate cyclase (GGDEF)-like protein